MNLFVEYLITCIVKWEDGYLAALVMIPVLLFVCDVLIRLAWQAVVVSWSLNCDANGDLEAMDSQVGIAALRNQIMSSKRLLYTFTNDARETLGDDVYTDPGRAIRTIGEEKEKNIFRHLKSLIHSDDDGKKAKAQNNNLDDYDEEDGDDIGMQNVLFCMFYPFLNVGFTWYIYTFHKRLYVICFLQN